MYVHDSPIYISIHPQNKCMETIHIPRLTVYVYTNGFRDCLPRAVSTRVLSKYRLPIMSSLIGCPNLASN